MKLKSMDEPHQRMHAVAFDRTVELLHKLRRDQDLDNASMVAVGTIHAALHFLVITHKRKVRRDIYNWLQRICDDLVI